jgi:uncharacterized coiled-coil DUF342 family protein
MGNIQMTDEELRAKHKEFINDSYKNALLQKKFTLIQRSIPKYIMNSETKELVPVYEPNTAKALEQIDKELNDYINSRYGDVLTKLE